MLASSSRSLQNGGVGQHTLKPHALLTSLLKEVSRSFYKTLRVLPGKIRPQISLAYLLARTTDTVADTELVPLERRLEALAALRKRILGTASQPVDFGELARHQGTPAERVLLENCEQSLSLLETFSATDRERLRELLSIITSGQELDLRRFAAASLDNIIALASDAELEDYTYRVAGCVGEFWTKMCHAHLFPSAHLEQSELMAKGVIFGRGLQLVNILRDLPADLRSGRCYFPGEVLARADLVPADLLQPANEARFRPVYDQYLGRAEEYLKTGWVYTHLVPRRCVRVRLACAWPLLIGKETLTLLRTSNVLEPKRRIKVSREWVKKTIWRSVLYYPWPAAWQKLFFSPTREH